LVLYPKGTYNVEKTDGLGGKDPCSIQKSGSRHIGISKNDCIVEAVDGIQAPFGVVNNNDATIEDVLQDISYENLNVKGLSSSGYVDCIHMQYTNDYRVKNCKLENAGRDGVYIGSPYQAYNPPKCTDGIIRDNHFDNNTRQDIALTHGDNLHIENNHFKTGIDIEPTCSTSYNRNIKVLYNNFDGCPFKFYNTKRNNDGSVLGITGSITAGTATLTVSDSLHLEVGEFIGMDGTEPDFFQILAIDGTTVTLHANAESTVTDGLVRTFLQLRDIQVIGNVVNDSDNSSYGSIRCFLATHITLANNGIYNSDADGMSIDRCAHVIIQNNRLMRDVGSDYYGEDYGIYLTRSQNKVVGNTIYGYEIGIRCSKGIGSEAEYKPYQTADNDLQNIVSQNHVKVEGNIGIWLQTPSDKSSVITDNIIERTNMTPHSDVNSAGIYVKAVGAVIRNNQIKGNFYYGIRLYSDSEDCIVEGNNINGCISDYINNSGTHNRIDGYYFSSSLPTEGTWIEGDMIKQYIYSGVPSWACSVSGTLGTLNSGATTGSITTGTNVLTLSATTGLRPLRNFITIAGVTGTFEIIKLDGTTAYLNKNADATVSAAAVAFSNPTFV
jgi:hypothetical protein